MAPEGLRLGQRLLGEDVEHGAADLTRFERGEEIVLGEMTAASDINDGGAARHEGEAPRVEDVLRLAGQRQQADDDVAAREEGREAAVLAMKRCDAGYCLRTAAPAGDVEAERCQLHGRIGGELADPQNADPALARIPLALLH